MKNAGNKSRGRPCASPPESVNTEMKIKKSAVKAALKPNDKTTVTPIPSSAPAPTASVTPARIAPVIPAVTPARTAPVTPARIAPLTPATKPPALTTIEVKLDVGFGNAVFMRGQGGGLTWERGLPLVCVDAKTWRWSGEARDPITFKLLINDTIWSAGNDLMIAPGQKIEVAPEFS